MKNRLAIVAAAVCIVAMGGTALADGMIVPVRHDLPVRGTWSVKFHDVKISVQNQVASVNINQAFVNNGGSALEVEYLFPIPPGAAIDAMTLVVDGKEMSGKLMKADEARKIYEGIVRAKKDPALLEYVGYGLYRTRAFPLEPGKPANVLVHYTVACKKDGELVEVFYPLNTEKFSATKIEEVKVTVDIKSEADISTVYSPTHDLNVERKDPRHVIAKYEVKNAIPDTDFQVYYKAANEQVGANVLSHRPDPKADGYYIVMVSPSPKLTAGAGASKDVVIVLDRSGSMAQDRKLDQAKEALKYVVSSLMPEDRFNVVTFCDSVDTCFNKLMDVNKKNVGDALDMVDRIEPSGGTNIEDALKTGLGMFLNEKRPEYLLFITDGNPTVKERNEKALLEIGKKANAAKARLFILGVGYDVNVRLIDNLVKDNRGLSDYVKPKEPLEAKISGLYNKIKQPVLTEVKVGIDNTRMTMTYPQELPDLFSGGQILLVGRYDKGGKTTLRVAGMLDGKEQKFEYPVTLDDASDSNKNAFVERLWATRRIGFLLDQIQLHGDSKEVTDELVKLSMQYGIMTPYTSFLADETVRLDRPAEVRERAEKASGALAREIGGDAGGGGLGQVHASNRAEMNQAGRAPMATAAPARISEEAGQRLRAFGVSADKLAGPGSGPVGAKVMGQSTVADYEQKAEAKQLEGVQNVGNQSLYRRGRVWVTPETAKVDVEKEKAQIKEVQRFTDEYFELVRANSIQDNQVLASQAAGDELLIRLRGQLYRIR